MAHLGALAALGSAPAAGGGLASAAGLGSGALGGTSLGAGLAGTAGLGGTSAALGGLTAGLGKLGAIGSSLGSSLPQGLVSNIMSSPAALSSAPSMFSQIGQGLNKGLAFYDKNKDIIDLVSGQDVKKKEQLQNPYANLGNVPFTPPSFSPKQGNTSNILLDLLRSGR